MSMDNPYITPGRVRAALRSLELRPTRGMGQNFLIDSQALAQIVAAGELDLQDMVLEIGPGLGVLTWELLHAAGRVVAIELDRRLAARLRTEFPDEARLTIVERDVLNIAPEEALAVAGPLPERYKVIANLPYAITSAVLRHLLEAAFPPELMVVLVQWEVAQRITARPGDLSVLAHSVQIYADPEIVARVPAASFHPAPAVDSAILRLRRHPRPAVEVDSIDGLMRVIKSGFLQARKKLGNALPGGMAAMGMRVDKQRVGELLRSLNIDPDRRAETLTLEEWAAVYNALKNA
ncbi:MAG: 16S rRNA (adenine(1518)-N(6)/adenine(1519)-N(6)) -dimethyltransferase RsmA [Roseiflexaceae bacterium]